MRQQFPHWRRREPAPLDDRGGTEVHVDAARGDQQIDLVRFRNKARPVQQVAQKDPRLCFDHGFYGRVDKPCCTCRITSQIVFQELNVALENPVDLRG
jgi:hypothetical protein